MRNPVTIEVSVIIPHHKDERALKKLVHSLEQQNASFSFEVIVISNPSSDAASRLLEDKAHVVHLQQKQRGVNAARNAGVRKARGNILLFLDSDCEAQDPFFLRHHYDLHMKNPHLICLGGLYSCQSTREIDIAYNYIQTKWLFHGRTDKGLNRYLIGGNFSCKRKIIQDQMFDEHIIYGGSETEFFLRLQGSYKLFPDLVVVHNTLLKRTSFVRKIFHQAMGSRYIEKKLSIKIDNDFDGPFFPIDKSKLPNIDFWLYLSDRAFNEGYQSFESCSKARAWNIYFPQPSALECERP